MNKDNFFYIPENQVSKPVSGEVIVNNYWMKHPEKGLMFFYGYGNRPYPQCNPDKNVSEIMKKQSVYQDCEIVHVNSVYMNNVLKAFEVEKQNRKLKKNDGPKM